jgi:hypothetical protein
LEDKGASVLGYGIGKGKNNRVFSFFQQNKLAIAEDGLEGILTLGGQPRG